MALRITIVIVGRRAERVDRLPAPLPGRKVTVPAAQPLLMITNCPAVLAVLREHGA
jgi:hypothetical protein